MSFLQKNWSYILVIFIASLFFVLTATYNYLYHEENYIKWGSPDETANYYFTTNYAKNSTLMIFEPANLVAEEVVRPRSMRSDHGWLKPVSFLGIIIYYGFLASFLGIGIIPYLTPILASIAIIFFFLFVKRLFNDKIALISASLLASFPVYIYYTVRSLFHNVLFLVFLIIAAYFLSLSLAKKYSIKEKFFQLKLSTNHYLAFLWPFLAGLALGGAIASRSSELIWLGPSLFIAWLFYFKRLGLRLFLILSGVVLVCLPIAYYNQILYGSFIYGGYGEMNTSIQAISEAVKPVVSANFNYFNNLISILKDNIFYFGYKPRQSLDMFYYYVIVMFPLLVILSGLGSIIFLVNYFRKFKKWRLVYLLTWFVLSSMLILYYGSWQFFDNPDPSRYTIGNSYTRYWLPIYTLAIPLAALAINFFSRLLAGSFGRPSQLGKYDRARVYLSNGLQLLLVSIWVSISLTFVFFGSEEGLIHAYYNHKRDKGKADWILDKTEPEAIIVTQYHDKQLFPERRVVVALLNHDQTNYSLGKLIAKYPIYYYNFFFPEEDYNYLNNRRLIPYGFNIELIGRQGPFGLYRLIPINNQE